MRGQARRGGKMKTSSQELAVTNTFIFAAPNYTDPAYQQGLVRRDCVGIGKRDAHPQLIVDGITLDMAVVVNKLEAVSELDTGPGMRPLWTVLDCGDGSASVLDAPIDKDDPVCRRREEGATGRGDGQGWWRRWGCRVFEC
jgi:hypothetical protein